MQWFYTPFGGVSLTQDTAICPGGNRHFTVVTNAGSFPYTYMWSTADTTSSINGLCAGTYAVTVSDAHGCDHFYRHTARGIALRVLRAAHG